MRMGIPIALLMVWLIWGINQDIRRKRKKKQQQQKHHQTASATRHSQNSDTENERAIQRIQKIQPTMGKDLSDEQVSAMKEAFTLFDTDGKIAPSELGILMHSLGGNPTQAQLKSIIVEEKLTSSFDFNRFVDLMSKHLKHIPTIIGEKLEPAEFDEWIREIDVGSDGKIKYEDFIARGETLDAGGKKKERNESRSPQFMEE